jgi:xylulose-5-phosphate/fructose-6-phosphate phosphoketolase
MQSISKVESELTSDELKKLDAYWRASNFLSVGQIYLLDNPLLREPLKREKSYRPEELFDVNGRLNAELQELAPKGHRRRSDNPHTNGGLLLRDLKSPDVRNYAVKVPSPGATTTESAREMGRFLRDIMKANLESKNFRLFSPDENNSNRWQDVLDVTNRCYMAEIYPEDDKLSPDGRVMEVLSEHQCQGWLEAYLLTGRHGFFSCYEAFIHIIDSMFNQHAKWLKTCNQIPWRRPTVDGGVNFCLFSRFATGVELLLLDRVDYAT